MRIRIALSTAVAVIVFTAAFIMLLGNTPALSARSTAHQSVRTPHATQPHTTLPANQLASFTVPTSVHTAHGATLDLSRGPASPAIVPAVAPPPPPPVVVPVTDSNSVATADWMCIRIHESGDRYNDPSEPSGAYGILISTWHAFGYSGWPYEAPAAVQDALALRLHDMYGFHPWSSRYACGL